MTAFDGIILAGGRSRRMGTDKALAQIRGQTFLERALDALEGARSVVVVGHRRPTGEPVVWTSEQPPGSGPAAGIAAALDFVTAADVVVLPVDLPGIDGKSVVHLLDSMRGDGAVLVDGEGSRQLPAGAYRADALRRAVAGAKGLEGISLRALLGGLDLVEVTDSLAIDCDTPQDVELVTALLRDRERWTDNA